MHASAPPPPAGPEAFGPVPLLVGVTGHRALPEDSAEQVRQGFRALLEALGAMCPHTPIALLSCLAEGADRLAAEEVLRFAGGRLVAVLPMPRHLYEQDFQTEQSRQEFDHLLSLAHTVHALPLEDPAAASPGPARDRQYQLAGAWVIRHASLLAALWDGQVTGKTGGTAEVVDFQLRGLPQRILRVSPLEPVETGPVAHILTPRAPGAAHAGRLAWLYPEESVLFVSGAKKIKPADAFKTSVGALERYNADVLDLRMRSPADITTSLGYLVGQNGPQSDAAGLALGCAEADAVANRVQRANLMSFKVLYGLGFLLVAAIGLKKQFASDVWASAAYFVLASAAALVVWLGKRRQWQNRHLDYRGLAEGLRVQLYWRMAGVEAQVEEHYLRRQHGDLLWIRQAVRAVRVENPPPPTADPGGPAAVKKLWVDDQLAYFAGRGASKPGAARANEHKRRRTGRVALVLAGVGMVLGMVDSSWLELDAHVFDPAGEWTVRAYQAVCVWLAAAVPSWAWKAAQVGGPVLLATAALSKAFGETMAFGENAMRYEKMGHLFALGSRALHQDLEKGAPDQARAVLFSLGREALAENGDWILLHRTRPLSIPKKAK